MQKTNLKCYRKQHFTITEIVCFVSLPHGMSEASVLYCIGDERNYPIINEARQITYQLFTTPSSNL